MRSIVHSAADMFSYADLEIMCPNLTSSELEAIVQFLYSGKISSSDELFTNQISNSLKELFGFPLSELTLEAEKSFQKSDDIFENLFKIQQNGSKSVIRIKEEIKDPTEDVTVSTIVIYPAEIDFFLSI